MLRPRENPPWLYYYEYIWGASVKEWPQYKYFARPIYKLLGGDRYPFFSVPVTFAITDYVVHQISINIMMGLYTGELSVDTLLQISLLQSFVWAGLSLPVAYHKQTKTVPTPPPIPKQEIQQDTHKFFSARKNKKKLTTISNREMAEFYFNISMKSKHR